MESRYLRGGHGEAGRRERALEALPNAGHTPGYTRIKTTAQDVDTHSKRVLLQEEFEALLDAPASTPPEDAPWSERRTAREDGAGRYGSRPTAFGAEMVMPLGARERREALTPELGSYDYILLNESAGKDSQAMMDLVVELAEAAGARDRIVAGHADLGRCEWPGTKELAEEHARHYGLRIELVRRELGDLLVQIEQRGKFPDKQNRFCTSNHKTSQVEKLITRLAWEHRERLGWRAHSRDPRAPRVRVLNCLGFRSEESPDRAKQPVFCLQTSTSVRTVDWWLPNP